VQDVAAQNYPDLGQYEVYACGSPEMTESAHGLLTQKCALPEDAFFCDAFSPA
jgi:CDP-6-deoxy-L-threo-D-glycero-4-hexulose-3-dehydrase reductase